MKHLVIQHRSPVYRSYRAARVRSLFNVTEDQGAHFELRIDAPLDERDWQLGLIIGPSGTGKSSLLRRIVGPARIQNDFEWGRRPIIDEIATAGDFNAVTGALSAVGLGTVPAWLRRFEVLSNGQQFRAELARILLEGANLVGVDEFTAALDRRVARVAAYAFGRAWRRRPGRFVAATCHRDVAAWLCPDWIIDTADGSFAWRSLRRRPPIELDIRVTNWSAYQAFEPHHYLKLRPMAGATNFVGYVDGEPVVHVAASTTVGVKSVRFCRLVVMPEWQGAGVGLAFLNHLAERHFRGKNRYDKRLTSIIHTSHPGLAAALRRDPRWILQSARLLGDRMGRLLGSGARRFAAGRKVPTFGGHLRSVLGFRYIGDRT